MTYGNLHIQNDTLDGMKSGGIQEVEKIFLFQDWNLGLKIFLVD
jgi:hypothetical protein